MPKIILSDIQSAVEKKYSDFEVHLSDGSVLLFVPAMRLPKEKRIQLSAALDIPGRAARLEADGEWDDIYEVYRDAFRISEKAEGNYERLAKALGDDPAAWQELFVAFNEDTQAGEASPSQSS